MKTSLLGKMGRPHWTIGRLFVCAAVCLASYLIAPETFAQSEEKKIGQIGAWSISEFFADGEPNLRSAVQQLSGPPENKFVVHCANAFVSPLKSDKRKKIWMAVFQIKLTKLQGNLIRKYRHEIEIQPDNNKKESISTSIAGQTEWLLVVDQRDVPRMLKHLQKSKEIRTKWYIGGKKLADFRISAIHFGDAYKLLRSFGCQDVGTS